MVYRYSWIAGLASIGFAFWRLTRLLLPTTGSGAKWQLVVLSGLVIGLIITWTAVTYRLRTVWIALINVGALFLASARFAAPSESFLIFPTIPGVGVLWSDLVRAFDVIRHGVEPVRPIPGIVVILTALFWLLGALLAWGLSKDHPFVALVPPLVVALQFATLDRRSNGLFVLVIFVGLVAATILAIALDERDRGAGRMSGERSRPPSHAPSATAALVVTITVAAGVIGAALLAPTVPTDGVLSWRTPGGLGSGSYGSIGYNPYVGIHQGLVSQEGIPLFTAKIQGEASLSEVYFRLLTMENYDNGEWSPGRSKIYSLDDTPLEEEGYEYGGETTAVTIDIEIEALGQGWLPAPYAVTGADGEDADAFGIRRADTALSFPGDRTYRGMQYSVTAAIPVVDPAVVAAAPDGGLSPLFLAAANDGESPPDVVVVDAREIPDTELYTALPPGLDPMIGRQATELTKNLSTPFEKGLAIEHWFRESGGFAYDLNTSQGHDGDVLATWLFDDRPENESYRRGYCEQFATSMAVMTRTIGIPTRVVLGFTPGDRIGVDEVIVRDDNAHSWVELWIPNQGWVDFDPTPRRDGANPTTSYGEMEDALGYDLAAYLERVPESVRPAPGTAGGLPRGLFSPERNTDDPFFVGSGGETTGSSSVPEWVLILGVLAAIFALIVIAVPLVKWAAHRSRMRRLADGDVSAAWEEIVVRLTDMAQEPDPAATPVEVAASVDETMAPLASVYARSIYGSSNRLPDEQVETARRSMELTGDRLATRRSPLERMRSRYRLGSLRRRFRR